MISAKSFGKKWCEDEARRRSIYDLGVKVQTHHYAAQEKRGGNGMGITDHCIEPHEKDNRARLRRSKSPRKNLQDIKDEIKYQIMKSEEPGVRRDSSFRW